MHMRCLVGLSARKFMLTNFRGAAEDDGQNQHRQQTRHTSHTA